MTPEELLKPRVKVIAPMPLMLNEVGSYLRRLDDGDEFSFGIQMKDSATHYYSLSDFCKWSHIFSQPKWHEDRKEGDMPKYVKYGKKGRIIKEVKNYGHYKGGKSVMFDDGSTEYLSYTLPATEEEYNYYNNIIMQLKSEGM